MNTELLFFILTAAFVIAGTTIAAWVDKLVTDELRKLRHKVPLNEIYGLRNDKWKFWGNFYALFTISVVITLLIALEHWWYALLWFPIMWLLWWTVHDLTTGWFILGKPLHISSDPISQFFGRIFQQSGWLMLGWRLLWLFLLTMGYLTLSFNITLW
jgi:hypothetical protein